MNKNPKPQSPKNSGQFDPTTNRTPARGESILKWLRLIGWAEGVSFLLLLFIAVPLKHLGNDESWVRTLGPIHGGLFLFYIAAAMIAAGNLRWPWTRVLLAFIASTVPFGPFIFESWLRRQNETQASQ